MSDDDPVVEFTMRKHRYVITDVLKIDGTVEVKVIERPLDGLPLGLTYNVSWPYLMAHGAVFEEQE